MAVTEVRAHLVFIPQNSIITCREAIPGSHNSCPCGYAMRRWPEPLPHPGRSPPVSRLTPRARGSVVIFPPPRRRNLEESGVVPFRYALSGLKNNLENSRNPAEASKSEELKGLVLYRFSRRFPG